HRDDWARRPRETSRRWCPHGPTQHQALVTPRRIEAESRPAHGYLVEASPQERARESIDVTKPDTHRHPPVRRAASVPDSCDGRLGVDPVPREGGHERDDNALAGKDLRDRLDEHAGFGNVQGPASDESEVALSHDLTTELNHVPRGSAWRPVQTCVHL